MTKKEWIVDITPKAQNTDIGTELVGTCKGPRRYRVGDWRVICELLDYKVTILVLQVGHRRDIYDFLH